MDELLALIEPRVGEMRGGILIADVELVNRGSNCHAWMAHSASGERRLFACSDAQLAAASTVFGFAKAA